MLCFVFPQLRPQQYSPLRFQMILFRKFLDINLGFRVTSRGRGSSITLIVNQNVQRNGSSEGNTQV